MQVQICHRSTVLVLSEAAEYDPSKGESEEESDASSEEAGDMEEERLVH